MALAVIAVCIAWLTLWKTAAAVVNWYARRNQYGPRTRVMKTLNWILNGDYE